MSDAAWDRLLGELQADPRVRRGVVFGHPAAKLGNRVFACEVDGDLVVKLGEEEVRALVADGAATVFDPLGGRPMRAWARVPATEDDPLPGWLELAHDARANVAAEG